MSMYLLIPALTWMDLILYEQWVTKTKISQRDLGGQRALVCIKQSSWLQDSDQTSPGAKHDQILPSTHYEVNCFEDMQKYILILYHLSVLEWWCR